MLQKTICAVVVLLLFTFSACTQTGGNVPDMSSESLQQEESGLPDGRGLLNETAVSCIHADTEAFLTEAFTRGVTAKLTELKPVTLYLSCEGEAVTEVYDAYKASFTSPSGVMTERYAVVYYRNVCITDDGKMSSDAPIHIGQRVEASATAQDGGYVIGYKSLNEMEKDVLGSMETAISHQIMEE